MSLDCHLIREIHELNAFVHENASEYYHTRPVARSKAALILPNHRQHTFDIEYDLKDLLFIGAITHNSVLLTGGTDIGKTTLAKLVMNGLFGTEEVGWHRIDVDTDFGKDTLTDPDFGAITQGRRMSEGFYSLAKYLQLPGLILDEINRTAAVLATKLLHVMDKDVSLPDGQRAKLGVPMNGTRYQYQITAINEGKGYGGTFDIDKAMRRRTVIEIPMDIFTLTNLDRLRIQQQSKKEIGLKNTKSHLEQVLRIHEKLESDLTLHPLAEMFILYLEAFDYCRNSITGEKSGVASKQDSVRHVCTQPVSLAGAAVPGDGIACNFLKTFEHELCPYVRGLTPGLSKNLRSVAKGFAVLRATKFVEMMQGYLQEQIQQPLSYVIDAPDQFTASLQEYAGSANTGRALAQKALDKYVSNLDVEKEDIQAALGFVAYSKIGLASAWTEKHYQGNRFEAVRTFCAEADKKFKEGMERPELQNISALLESTASPEELGRIKGYCEQHNPWLWRVLSPYFVKGDHQEQTRKSLQLYRE